MIILKFVGALAVLVFFGLVIEFLSEGFCSGPRPIWDWLDKHF
jgi:hypothetical protein